MKIYITQLYAEAGASFPFSANFQRYISAFLTDNTKTSETFEQTYGSSAEISFFMSAKSGLQKPEIKGPNFYKADNEVEYVIFLPFHDKHHSENSLRAALTDFLDSIILTLNSLNIDTSKLSKQYDNLISDVLRDKTFIRNPEQY